MSSKNSDLAAYMHTSSLTRSLLFTKIQESTPRHRKQPKAPPRHPKGPQKAPQGTLRRPKWHQKAPQGTPRRPKGPKRRPKKYPKAPQGVLMAPQGVPQCLQVDPMASHRDPEETHGIAARAPRRFIYTELPMNRPSGRYVTQ